MRATDGTGLRKLQRGFAAIPNETVWDDELPARAMGLLVKMVALSEGTKFETDKLVARVPDGREAVMTGLRALRRLGYYRVERRRRPDGRFVTGVSVSDVRVAEWAHQHAAACREQGTDKPKWDVSVLVDEHGEVVDKETGLQTFGDELAGQTDNGFSRTGETGDGEPRSSGNPDPGEPAVKRETNHETDGGYIPREPHQGDVPAVDELPLDDADQEPTAPPAAVTAAPVVELVVDQDVDAEGLPWRSCPAHRSAPALGPCPPCGTWRRNREAALDERVRIRAARDAELREATRARAALDVAEVDSCRLCDDDAVPYDVDLRKCLHDSGKNLAAVESRRATMAAMRAATSQRKAS